MRLCLLTQNNIIITFQLYCAREMNSFLTKTPHKQVVLENPFHPLDLSAHDLLTVYKKFQASRQANRNPKQQLPIQTVAQLISSLKGCKPSYVQKCMSQALIKENISWNEFLAFLDQESQVRYKILDWLLHERAIIKYRFKGQIPFRFKILDYFENITDVNFISMGEDRVVLVIVDHKQILLINVNDNKFELIDELTQKNNKDQVDNSHGMVFSNESTIPKNMFFQRLNKSVKNRPEVKEKGYSLSSKNVLKSERLIPIADPVNSIGLSIRGSDQDIYYKKQRKNIHALFTLFSQLPYEHSAKFASVAVQKIETRNLNSTSVNQIKQTYEAFATQKKHQIRSTTRKQQKPIDVAKKNLQELFQQKAILSYNPYKISKSSKLNSLQSQFNLTSNQKKLNHDRKQKKYTMESIHEKFCPELSCIGLVYYNFELSIVKVARQYNKIILDKQDCLKITYQNNFKKNLIIEMLDFFFHRTTNKWFLMVLFRNQVKHEPKEKKKDKKNEDSNDSYIKGYEIESTSIKWKNEKKYSFAKKKEEFIIDLGQYQIIKFIPDPEYGLHFISHSGKYLTWKEDYITQNGKTIYWRKEIQQKFIGHSLSLSCICVNSELNKSVLGTIKGQIVIYDLFSKQYKIKKISNHPVTQIIIQKEKAFIMCENEKIILFDILRSEQIQVVNVRNEQKLHDKVDKFTINEGKIVCYGSCIRVYEEFVDESLQQQKFKMENIYTWRLHKLDKSKGKDGKNNKMLPTFRKSKTNAQLLTRSQNLFVIFTQIQEAIFFSIDTMAVKFTTILDIPQDEKVMRITISPDEKLLGLLLFNQTIYVFNIYTQELLFQLKSTIHRKYTSISFLDKKNQYLLACGTQTGKICLVTKIGISSDKQLKKLEFHEKPVTITTLKGDLLISSSENQDLAIWQLPFNILKHEIKLKGKLSPNDYLLQKLGTHQQICFFRTAFGIILQINVNKGEIKSIYKQFVNWNLMSFDIMMNLMIGIPQSGQLHVMQRRNDKETWILKQKYEIDQKNEVIGIGVVQSQKAVVYTKNGLYIWHQKNQKLSKFKSFVQSI